MSKETIRHGTTTAYAHHKCRCDECRAAVAEYNRKRQQAMRDGTWVPGRAVIERKQCTGPECDRVARHLTPQPLCESHYQQVHVRRVSLTPLRRVRRVKDGMKECNRCAEVKPVGEFPHAKGKIASSCKACQSLLNRMHSYGLTFDEAKALMEQACAACGSTDRLHVDHCHDTGKVRGVLCHNCNTVLTKHMTPEILRRLADYLEQ